MDSFGRRLLEGFRIRLLLARQWIHVYVSLLRLLGSGNFAPARGDTTGAVLGQGHDVFYACPVESTSRSKMNVSFTFRGGDEALEKKFSVEAQWVKFFTLAGHRSVDGCRASLYNGLPLEGVEEPTRLVEECSAPAKEKANKEMVEGSSGERSVPSATIGR